VVFALLPIISHAKGADGLVILKGTIQGASTNDEEVSFVFMGKLSFSFFTAARGDADRKQVDLQFDVKKLPIRIPKFGTSEYDNEDNPFRVTFKNAAKLASEASHSGEAVSIVLFRPKLSYDINGVIEKIECTHAQVLPDRLERESLGHGMP
jgi:hypothetical protein